MAATWLRSIVALALLAITLVACSAPAALPAPGREPDTARAGAPAVGAPTGGDEESDDQAELADGAYIVRTGHLRLELTELAPALDAAQRLVSGVGGYVSQSEEHNTADVTYATITYRVPVERWNEALAGLRGLGERVISENTEAADVTSQIIDLDARLLNLRASETALQAIMQRATTIDDVLKVQRELTEVRASIERLTAERTHLADRAALATITVSFEVRTTAVATASEGWNLGREVDLAFASLVGIAQRAASIGVWLLIVALPVLLPFVVIALLWVRIYRARENRVTMGVDDPRR
ncbi:MAG: DUF4349 domain-containing protein [Chloroflexota bacterium]|nr:DUF4349 domain-containing protein [Chloroflexota bacterium]